MSCETPSTKPAATMRYSDVVDGDLFADFGSRGPDFREALLSAIEASRTGSGSSSSESSSRLNAGMARCAIR